MIQLTDQQIRDLGRRDATPPRVVNPHTQERFVLLSEEDYHRMISYDTSPWTDDERDALRAEALNALGWDGMEAYQDDKP